MAVGFGVRLAAGLGVAIGAGFVGFGAGFGAGLVRLGAWFVGRLGVVGIRVVSRSSVSHPEPTMPSEQMTVTPTELAIAAGRLPLI